MLEFGTRSILLPYGYEKLLFFFTGDADVVVIFYDFVLIILLAAGAYIEWKFCFTPPFSAPTPILELVYSLEKLVAFDGLVDIVDVFIPVFTML